MITQLPESVGVIYLVAGSHDQKFDYDARSSEYIRRVRDFFVSKGYWVGMRLASRRTMTLCSLPSPSTLCKAAVGTHSCFLASMKRWEGLC